MPQRFSQTLQCLSEISRNKMCGVSIMASESEDDGFESVISAATTEKPKAKRKLTAAQLEQLALAREKANAVRKRNAQQRKVQKQKEQKLKDFQRQREQDELDKQLSQFSAPRKAPTPVAEEESSESSESEEETPPPVKAVKAKSQKSKKKKQQKQRPVSDSSESSSEEEYVPPKKTRVKHQHQPQQHHQDELYDHQMRRAFASLFPNSFV